MTERVVIVGAGEAGGTTAIALRQGGFTGEITLLGDEPYVPYERPPLSKQFLAGEVETERTYLRFPEFYGEKNISLKTGVTVTALDRGAKAVRLKDSGVLPYDKLVLATGGRVRRLPCPGSDLPGVHYLRTIDDVRGFRDRLVSGCKLVIVGGGFIGLEVAAVAVKRGCAVTVLEALPQVLSRVTAPEMSRFYANVHAAAGVTLRTTMAVEAFTGDDRVQTVRCKGGETFAAGLVIVGIGIVPNVELARDAGLAVNDGIVVDEFCRTADPDVFAAGDCTNHPNALYGQRLRLESVPNALGQGKAAAHAILGKLEAYTEVPWFWSDQYDLKLQMVGLSAPGDQVVIRGLMSDRKFSACYLRGGVFVACQSVNMAKDFIQSKKLIAAKVRPDPVRLADATIALKDLMP